MKRYFLMFSMAAAIALIGVNVGASDEADTEFAPNDPSLAVATFAGGCFWCKFEIGRAHV